MISANTSFENSIRLEFPQKIYSDSQDFKVDRVRYYQQKGYRVIVIGDGYSDLQAARHADLVFAVEGSSLSKFFPNTFTDFHELKQIIAQRMNNVD